MFIVQFLQKWAEWKSRQSIAALAPFARFFRIVFISGSSHKELLWTYFAAEGILVYLASKLTGSTLLGVHNFFDRSHSVDEEAILANRA